MLMFKNENEKCFVKNLQRFSTAYNTWTWTLYAKAYNQTSDRFCFKMTLNYWKSEKIFFFQTYFPTWIFTLEHLRKHDVCHFKMPLMIQRLYKNASCANPRDCIK